MKNILSLLYIYTYIINYSWYFVKINILWYYNRQNYFTPTDLSFIYIRYSRVVHYRRLISRISVRKSNGERMTYRSGIDLSLRMQGSRIDHLASWSDQKCSVRNNHESNFKWAEPIRILSVQFILIYSALNSRLIEKYSILVR